MLILHKTTTLSVTLTVILILQAAAVWAETVEFEGLIQPYEVVEIGAPAEGIVAKVAVDRSSLVKKEQILVELESSVQQAALEKAEAMAAFDGEIGLQKTQLALQKRVYNRVKTLSGISAQDKDLAATEIIKAEHRLEKARETRMLAELELKKARAVFERCSIKSPISGVVVERYVSPGEYVNTQPLLRVAQINPLRVEVIVPAQMFGRITPGMSARVVPELPAYGEQVATVTIVDKVIDSASSTFGVRLELPNAEQQMMPSGLKCLVRFEIDKNGYEVRKVNAQIVRHQIQH